MLGAFSIQEEQANKSTAKQIKAQEQTWVAAAQQGDTLALNELIEVFQSRVYAFITAKGVKSHHDVEELVQDTFIQVQKNIGNYEGRSSFSTWVLGISLNLVRNHINRSVQYKYNFIDEQDTHLIDENVSTEPERNVSSIELLKAMEKAMLNLPQNLREVVIMTCIDGLSYEESAKRLNISVCNLKSRLFRARKMLKATLAL